MKRSTCVTLAALLLLSFPALAVDRYVRPGASGTGSGTDWTNAYPGLPSSLNRGDRYFLADGSYGGYVFDDPNSGSSSITIKKATIADHGSAAGWSNDYGDGQATFTSWRIYTDYYVFDGSKRNSSWQSGAINEYGIRVASAGPIRLDNGAGSGGDNLTFQYIDAAGGGRDSGAGDDVIYGLAGNSNITFRYCALHDSDRTIFLLRGEWQNLVVEHSYLARNASSPAVHGEILSDVGSDNVTFRYNIIEDPEGTAVWAILNGDGSKSSSNTASNWKIYGNVIRHTSGYGREGFSGIIFCANDASNRNWMDNSSYYNNTHVNLKSNFYGVFIQSSGSGNSVRNNIFYNSGQVVHANPGAIDNNWYYNTTESDSGNSKVVCSQNCSSYFRNISGLDAVLVAAIPGAFLASEFAGDIPGNARGGDGVWDRGAFEFVSTGSPSVPVAPPTNLSSSIY